MADFSPMQQFLMAYGSGLMGTRGAKGFGRAGLMGLEALDRGTRTSLLERESARREEEEKQMAQFRQLQMQQMQVQMAEAQRMRDLKAAWAKKITGASADRQAAAAQASAPPSFGPVDTTSPEGQMANIFRGANMVNDRAAAAQRASRPMMSYEEALGAQVMGVDPKAVETWKDQAVGIEMKPGAPYMDPFSGQTRYTGDPKEGYTIGADGTKQLMPGHLDITQKIAGAKAGAEAEAKARYDWVEMEDPNNPGKVGKFPGDIARSLYMGGRQAPLPAPVEAAPQAVEAPRPGPPPPATPRPPQQPAQAQPPARPQMPAGAPPTAGGDRARLLQEEVAKEQAKLRELQSTPPASLKLKYGTQFDPQAELARTQNNLAALNRELAAGRPQAAAPAAPQAAPAQPQVQPPQPVQPAPPAGAQPPGAAPRTPEQIRRDAERAQEIATMRGKAAITFQNTKEVLENVQIALPLVSPKTTGFIGARLAKLEGSDAFQLREAIKPIKASLGFDQLQLMRDFSKTGGALGQVAIPELEALQARVRSLNADQQESYMRANLFAIEAHYRAYWDKMRTAWLDQYGIDLKDEIPQVFANNTEAVDHTDALIKLYTQPPGGRR